MQALPSRNPLPKEGKDEKQYEQYREAIVHEDDLLNHRITWFLVSQTFLVAAFAGVLFRNTPSNTLDGQQFAILMILAALGYILSILVFYSAAAAFLSLKRLRVLWCGNEPATDETLVKIARATGHPPLIYAGTGFFTAVPAVWGIPLAIMLGWAAFVTTALWPWNGMAAAAVASLSIILALALCFRLIYERKAVGNLPRRI